MTEEAAPTGPAPAESTRRAGRLRGATERTLTRLGRWSELLRPGPVGQFVERLYELEFLDRMVALASKAFVSFFPFMLAVAAVLPPRLRADMIETVRVRFGLSGPSYELVRSAFGDLHTFRTWAGALSLLLLLFYATSFTTSLQRVYLRAWRRPRAGGGPRNIGRGLLVLAGILATLTISGSLRRVLFGPAGEGLTLVLSFGLSVLVWWLIGFLLLRGEIRWRALFPPALITAGLAAGNTALALVWMPRSVEANQLRFGFFGITMSIVSWFVALAFCIIAGAAAGAVMAEDQHWLGRWVRGPAGSVLRGGSPGPLPAPSRTLTIFDAFGRGSGAPDTASDEQHGSTSDQ